MYNEGGAAKSLRSGSLESTRMSSQSVHTINNYGLPACDVQVAIACKAQPKHVQHMFEEKI